MAQEALAAALEDAFADLHPHVRLQFRAQGEGLELHVTVYEAPGELAGMISGPLDLRLDDPARLLRYGAAVARHLRASPRADAWDWLDALSPSALMLPCVLEDAELRTARDFDALLADPARYERARRLQEVRTLVPAPRPVDDRLLALVYPLTEDGRACLPWSATTSALRELVARGEHALVVDAMACWIDTYDPDDPLWAGGPTRANLLLLGAWTLLDPHLQGPLRRRALDAVDRIADACRPTAAQLVQAGLVGAAA